MAVDLRRSAYFAVNRTGAAIWSALARGASRSELVSHLSEGFGIERQRATEDLEAFLGMLAARGLLEG